MRTRGSTIELNFAERARWLRRHAAAAERTTWRLLRNRQMLGLKFRRQHVIRGFIVDFYCAELGLVLEIDGEIHEQSTKSSYDQARTSWLEASGFRVVRLASKDVSEARLRKLITSELSLGSPSPHRGEGVWG
jgi:very-short-patch-repair endonuclease